MDMKHVPMTGDIDWSHVTRIIDNGRHWYQLTSDGLSVTDAMIVTLRGNRPITAKGFWMIL